jgi:hypothetical protein
MAVQNYGLQVETIGIVFLTLAWISVILRSSVRVFIIRLFVIVGEKYGTGRLAADISQRDFQTSMKVLPQAEFIYVCVYVCVYVWTRDSNRG